VTVVGTRFAVHERGEGTRVTVEEGKVAVTNTLGAARAFLEPGQFVQFHKNDNAFTPSRRGETPLGFYTTWWQDHLKLEDTPFDDIARRLEETYGVLVRVRDESLRQRKLSGAIENRDLDVIITALAKALGATAHREGEVVVFGDH
jgi:ferric-dicitrate binding protein FerR (iron transport regulator)